MANPKDNLPSQGASASSVDAFLGDLNKTPVPFAGGQGGRKSTRLNSSHITISYAVFCLKKKTKEHDST